MTDLRNQIGSVFIHSALRSVRATHAAFRRADRTLTQLRLDLELRYCVQTCDDLTRMMSEMGWVKDGTAS